MLFYYLLTKDIYTMESFQFSPSVVSDSLWSPGLQHTKLPCPSPTPGACSNPYPSQWCHLTISSSVIPFSSCLQSSLCCQSQHLFHWVSSSPKYWSFSISPSNEYSGQISFAIEYYSAIEKNEILPFAAPWMDFGGYST